MTGFLPLFAKEIREQVRTYRFVIVAGVFLLFAVTTPLMLKYLPQILEAFGKGMNVTMPDLTPAQALAEYAGNIGQLGLLIAVLLTMGSVASEVKHGTVVMTLSKPVSALAFTTAKLAAAGLTFIAALAAASGICYGYTVWLIGPTDFTPFLYLNLLTAVFLVFCLALTILFSSLFRNAVAAGGLAIAVLIFQAVLTGVPGLGNLMPGKLTGWGVALLNGPAESYWWALGITVAVIAACLALTPWAIARKDL